VGIPSLGVPPQFGLNGGGYGFADSWFQPFTLGWNLKRADTFVAYAFTAPTGRYTAGASTNVGSGYWGNNIESNTTVYLTKSKGTTTNLVADWEVHGQKNVASTPAGQFSHITPGQAFTMEWGIGQFLPLDKQMHKLLEVGLIGYDQWQVSVNGGNYLIAQAPVAASRVPYYSVHAVGFQTNFILPAKNWHSCSSTNRSIRPKPVRKDAQLCLGARIHLSSRKRRRLSRQRTENTRQRPGSIPVWVDRNSGKRPRDVGLYFPRGISSARLL
jgi:hypothetical protein